MVHSSLFDGNAYHTGSHHAECTRGGDGQIHHPPAHEGASIIDATLDGAASGANCEDTTHRPGAMGACHAVTAATIIGGDTALGVSGRDEEERGCDNQRGSNHGSSHERDPCPSPCKP